MFKSLSRTVTYTRELISIYICVCYSQGDGPNTSLSKLSYLVLYQLSSCLVVPCLLYSTKYPMY